MEEDKIYYGHVLYYSPYKTYGQIKGLDGEIVFLHKTEMVGCDCLFKEQWVSYQKKDEGKSRKRAINVTPKSQL